jgi:hypothetical protein
MFPATISRENRIPLSDFTPPSSLTWAPRALFGPPRPPFRLLKLEVVRFCYHCPTKPMVALIMTLVGRGDELGSIKYSVPTRSSHPIMLRW